VRLPTNDVLAALAGDVIRRERLPATIAISTDSRAIRPGDTFLALRGERFDGHDYVRQATAGGAVAAIVERAAVVPEGAAAIVVPDTLRAYLALGGLARARLRGPVVAITGSTGKTTTKTFLRQAIEATGRGVVATPENENNEIGVAKFLLACEDADPRAAVVEMGARKYRDLAPLVAEQLILALTSRALCREDCLGLCPHCGINLNLHRCDCEQTARDARLAVLRTLKLERS